MTIRCRFCMYHGVPATSNIPIHRFVGSKCVNVNNVELEEENLMKGLHMGMLEGVDFQERVLNL